MINGYLTKSELINNKDVFYNIIELEKSFISDYENKIPNEYKEKWPLHKSHWWSRAFEYDFIIKSFQEANINANDRVLEVGPGCSFLTKYLIDKFNYNNLTLEDVDPNVLSFWGAIFNKYKDINLSFERGGDYNYIYSVSVIEHIPNPEAFFEELINSLMPGGRFFITLDIDLCSDQFGLNTECLNKILGLPSVKFDIDRSLVHPLDIITPKDYGWYHQESIYRAKDKSLVKNVKNYIKKILNKDQDKNIAVLMLSGTKL